MREEPVREDGTASQRDSEEARRKLGEELRQIYLRTSEAAFQAEPHRQVPARVTGGMLDVGEDEKDFCTCESHSVPRECFTVLPNTHAQIDLCHFASRFLDETTECLERNPIPARSKVRIVREFFDFGEADVPRTFTKWLHLARRVELARLEDTARFGYFSSGGKPRKPFRFYSECTEIASAVAPIFRDKLEETLRVLAAQEGSDGEPKAEEHQQQLGSSETNVCDISTEDFSVEDGAPGLAPIAQPDTPKAKDNRFQREGSIWVISHEGETGRFPSVRGFGYIATLLRNPLEPIEARRLIALSSSIGSGVETDTSIESEIVSDNGGIDYEVLDEKAIKQYQDRALRLSEEITDARERQDLAKVDELMQELEFIEEQRSANTGLRGKTRKFADDNEKARTSVTNAIRRALLKIATVAPRTAAHLQFNIETGSSLMYRDKDTSWKL